MCNLPLLLLPDSTRFWPNLKWATYAAKVSAFSKEGFEEHGVAYGLMKVVNVQADKIIVITEDAAWPEAAGAQKDLNGDLSDITWDESERIEVKRADLPRMVADGRIVETRRMDK